ncbi:MAG TPA: LCP family protein [Tissierellales bacterium]|nr:LCP family protein [Tissierellales bacterium]
MGRKFRRAFFISFLCFIILYGLIGYYTVKKRNPDVTLGKNIENKDEILFLVLGIDGNDMTEATDVRTDTMMLAKLNFKSGELSILSIPRDTRVMLKSGEYAGKINAAHKLGGAEESIKTVKELLDIDLEYYVKIDYQFVREVVDLIGGVEMDIPFHMKYDDISDEPPLHIDIEEGRQVLDGDKAIQFLRYRKSNDGSGGYKEGDVGRIKAQQEFIKAFMGQVLKPSNILKSPMAISKYYKYVETNIPMKIAFKGAFSGRKIDTEDLNINTLPGEGRYIDGISYFIHYEEPTQALIKEMFENHILN